MSHHRTLLSRINGDASMRDGRERVSLDICARGLTPCVAGKGWLTPWVRSIDGFGSGSVGQQWKPASLSAVVVVIFVGRSTVPRGFPLHCARQNSATKQKKNGFFGE